MDNFVHNLVDDTLGAHFVAYAPPIADLIRDFSREMGDMEHVASNTTQAHRIYAQAGVGLDDFFVVVYEARVRTRKTGGVGNRMAYFFAVLRDLCAPGAGPRDALTPQGPPRRAWGPPPV